MVGSSVLWEAVLDLAPWAPFWQLVSQQVLFCPSVTPPASTPRGSWLPWDPLQLYLIAGSRASRARGSLTRVQAARLGTAVRGGGAGQSIRVGVGEPGGLGLPGPALVVAGLDGISPAPAATHPPVLRASPAAARLAACGCGSARATQLRPARRQPQRQRHRSPNRQSRYQHQAPRASAAPPLRLQGPPPPLHSPSPAPPSLASPTAPLQVPPSVLRKRTC